MGNLLKREQIKMKISLTNQQKVFLTAQAATLKVPAQEKFLRRVANILERCPQTTISTNHLIMAVQTVLSDTPCCDVIISRCNGATDDADDPRVRRDY